MNFLLEALVVVISSVPKSWQIIPPKTNEGEYSPGGRKCGVGGSKVSEFSAIPALSALLDSPRRIVPKEVKSFFLDHFIHK